MTCGPLAQWLERLPSKEEVVGSIPSRACLFFFLGNGMATLEPRTKCNADTARSITNVQTQRPRVETSGPHMLQVEPLTSFTALMYKRQTNLNPQISQI